MPPPSQDFSPPDPDPEKEELKAQLAALTAQNSALLKHNSDLTERLRSAEKKAAHFQKLYMTTAKLDKRITPTLPPGSGPN